MCKASTAAGYPVDPTTEAFPSVGFEGTSPAYIPMNVVIPTLDDVPDGPDTGTDGYQPGNWTKTDLAWLDANNYHWDLFINGDNWDGPLTGDATMDDPDGHNDIIDILQKHYPANHTIYHTAVGTKTANDVSNSCIPACCDCAPVASNCTKTQCTTADPSTGRGQCNEDCVGIEDTCESELQGVEAMINKFSNGGTPHLTRFRPPYGLGYAPYGTAAPTSQKAIAKYAVAIGWNVDSTDANQNPGDANATATYVVNTVTSALNGGAWGIVLTHGVLPWTAQAIPTLYDPKTGSIPKKYKIGNVEDAVCWKYGMHSWDVINKFNNYTGCDKRGPN
jgi:hypothetical protein